MNIQLLLDLSLLAVGVRIKGKNVDEMWSIFNIAHPPQQAVNASGQKNTEASVEGKDKDDKH